MVITQLQNTLETSIVDKIKKSLHRPGIEPGPPAWQASILPLNQRCADTFQGVMIHI